MTPSARLDAAYLSYLVSNDCGPLLHAMYPVARSAARLFIRPDCDREAVVQRIVTEAWSKLDRVPHNVRSYNAFFRCLARRRCIDHNRAVARRKEQALLSDIAAHETRRPL